MTGSRSPRAVCVGCAALIIGSAIAEADVSLQSLDESARTIEPRLIEWRRDIHQHPELSNREVRTSALVAKHLESLGLEVHRGIAHTGVVAVLRGTTPGPTIGLRADMDALPVTERTDLPFRSTATGEYRGQTTGVMHACGHDAHTAILMATAQVLAGHRKGLPGTVLFVFQPAEEGPPEGERGGAPLMLEEGLFEIARPEAMFGLHVSASMHTGVLGYRAGPSQAGSDFFRIVVMGKQTHGARPWLGVDPIVAAAQIVDGLQTVVSRKLDITDVPAVVTIGAIHGGVRHNIIPDSVEMLGTLRTFRPDIRELAISQMRTIATNVAAANGATAELSLEGVPNPALINDEQLTRRMVPALERVAPGNTRAVGMVTVSEDFAFYAREVPSLFFRLGVTPPDRDLKSTPDNHSPLFYIDEAALVTGLRAMLSVAVDYLQSEPGAPGRTHGTGFEP